MWTTSKRRLEVAKRKIRNVALDLRYGAILQGTIESSHSQRGAHETANTAYDVLAAIFPPGSIHDDDVLVDVGCGKGRVINWWLSQGYRNRIIGIELDPGIADQTRRRLRRYKTVSIICGDAIEDLPSDGTLFYLYDPFDPPVVRAFGDRLARLLDGSKDVRIYYFHPLHSAVFEDDQRWQVTERRLADRLWPEGEVAIIRPAGSLAGESPHRKAEPSNDAPDEDL